MSTFAVFALKSRITKAFTSLVCKTWLTNGIVPTRWILSAYILQIERKCKRTNFELFQGKRTEIRISWPFRIFIEINTTVIAKLGRNLHKYLWETNWWLPSTILQQSWNPRWRLLEVNDGTSTFYDAIIQCLGPQRKLFLGILLIFQVSLL